jgi:tetratricopeptide (TPR) repeat protein
MFRWWSVAMDEFDLISVPDDLRFGRYNFQPRERIRQIVHRLSSDAASKVVLLAGPEGSGRAYLWSAALHALNEQGQDWHSVPLDLDGFEPDVCSQEKFLTLLLSKSNRAEGGMTVGSVRSLSDAMARLPGPPGFVAIGLSILLGLGKVLAEAEHLLRSNEPRGPLPALPADEWLIQLLADLSKDRPLALFCRKPEQLTVTMRRLLRQVTDQTDRIALALPCAATDSPEALWPHALTAPLRIELTPLDRRQAAAIFDERFKPHRCPRTVIDALWTAAGGWPKHIVALTSKLLERKALVQDADGCWYLSPGGDLADISMIERFQAPFLKPLYAMLETVSNETRQDLVRFLSAAVLCGDYVPTNAILHFLALPPERSDALLDLLDTRLVCPEDRRSRPFADVASDRLVPYFDDLQYGHPGLPAQAVYRFRSPLIRHAIHAQKALFTSSTLAADLLACLHLTLPVTTRASAEIHLAVLSALEDSDRREEALRRLAWWVDAQESEALESTLVADVREGTLNPDVLWNAWSAVYDLWPPHRCLSLLQAYGTQAGGPPLARLPLFLWGRASCRLQQGDSSAALEDGQLALRLLEAEGADNSQYSLILHLLGQCYAKLEKYSEAIPWIQRAIAAREQGDLHGRVDHHNLGASLHLLGQCYIDLERYTEALPHLERAVAEIQRGDLHGRVDHDNLGTSLRRLGECYLCLEQHIEAMPHLEQAIAEIQLGDLHGRVDHEGLGASLGLLGQCHFRLKQHSEAMPCFERATAEIQLGDLHGRVNHEGLGASLLLVGQCYIDLERYTEALPHLERGIAEIQLGDLHGRVNHSAFGAFLLLPGVCHLALLEYVEALPHLERAIAEIQQGDPQGRVDHALLARGSLLVVGCLVRLKRYIEALPRVERAIAEIQLGDPQGRVDHDDLGASLRLLGQCYVGLEQYVEALPHLERAIAEIQLGDLHGRVDHDNLGTSLRLLGRCLVGLNRHTDAIPYLERAIVEIQLGDLHGRVDHDNLGTSLRLLGRCYLDLNEYAEALPCLQRAIAEIQQGDADGRVDHDNLARGCRLLGRCLVGLNRHTEAIPYLERAIVESEQGDRLGHVDRQSLDECRRALAEISPQPA